MRIPDEITIDAPKDTDAIIESLTAIGHVHRKEGPTGIHDCGHSETIPSCTVLSMNVDPVTTYKEHYPSLVDFCAAGIDKAPLTGCINHDAVD